MPGTTTVFEGPVTLMPEVVEQYALMVPLHETPVSMRQYSGGRWHECQSAAPMVHLTTIGDKVGWQWPAGARVAHLQMPFTEMERFITDEMRLVGMESNLDGLAQIEDPEVFRVARSMAAVLADPRPGQDVLLDAYARVLLVHMVRSYRAVTEARSGHLSAELYTKVLGHIDARIAQTIHVTELCDLVGMSESAFLRAVKATTGQTPHELIRDRRLEAARGLLRRADISIGDVAIATGFADQAHLSRTFKKAFGASPRDWRKTALG